MFLLVKLYYICVLCGKNSLNVSLSGILAMCFTVEFR